MIAVLIVGAILMLLVIGATAYALKSQNISRHDQDWNAALAAAEAGIDEYLYRLNRNGNYWVYNQSNPDPANGAFTGWVPVPGASNDAEFRYTVDASTIAADGTVKLTATGRVLDTSRTVRATLRRRNFLDYLYFTEYETLDPASYTGSPYTPIQAQAQCSRHFYDIPARNSNCTDITFFTRDEVRGPLHSNDALLLSGSPKFFGDVSTSWNRNPPRYRVNGSASPVFARAGDPRYLPALKLPPSNQVIKRETDPVLGGTGCLYTGPTSITLNSSGTMTVNSPLTRSSNSGCGTGFSSGPRTVAIPPNGVVYVQGVPGPGDPNHWPNPAAKCAASKNPLGYPISNDITTGYGCFEGDAFVSGTLKGVLTIAAEDSIIAGSSKPSSSIITGDVVYSSSTAHMLGLVANNFVQVYHPVRSNGNELASVDDFRLQAAILTVVHSFTVQNYSSGDPLGDLSVFGAIGQLYRGPVGQFSGSSLTKGYEKDYVYDSRLKYQSPPHFLDPVQSAWGVSTWAEIRPAF